MKKKTNRKRLPDTILAQGETTGHYHEAIGDQVGFFETETGERILDVPTTATVVHQEHKPIVLEVGEYDVIKVREYDHWAEESREVRD